MKLTDDEIFVLRQLHRSDTKLGKRYEVVWFDHSVDPLESYEQLMDIQSPLMDEVRQHLTVEMVAYTLTGELP